MDFSPTDEQELLRDTATTLLTHECPTSLVRACIDDPTAAGALWEQLRPFTPLAVADTTDLAIFLEAMGYAAAPGSFLPTVALFGGLVATMGSALIDDVTGGACRGTVAAADSNGVWLPHDHTTKHAVLELGLADTVAVIGRGPSVAIVDAEAVVGRQLETIDPTRRVFEIDAPEVDSISLDAGAYAAWIDRATVCVAAEMVGAARRCFDMALAYAKEREQFGRPIGSFQAIQHRLAEASLELERATAAVQFAAMTVDASDEYRTRAVHVAKAAAGRAARRNVKDSIQVHGGIGYTWEHDLHLFLRRATASEHLFGGCDWHHDQIASLVF